MAERLVVDEARCEGHGRCYALHPELFDADDDGRPIVVVQELTDELRSTAAKARNACPEQAVLLLDEDGAAAP